MDALAHPSQRVRLPASVAVWSLLYHSEKSLSALRALPTQAKLDDAMKILEKDEQEEAAGKATTIQQGETPGVYKEEMITPNYSYAQNLASLRRALGSIRILLLSSATAKK